MYEQRMLSHSILSTVVYLSGHCSSLSLLAAD